MSLFMQTFFSRFCIVNNKSCFYSFCGEDVRIKNITTYIAKLLYTVIED